MGKFGQNTPYAESRTLLSVSTRLVLKACKGATERLLGGRTHTINFSFHSNPNSSLVLLSAAELAIRGHVATWLTYSDKRLDFHGVGDEPALESD